MLWIPLSLDLARHPKTRRLAALLGTTTPAVVGHLAGLWCNAVIFAKDGDLTETEPAALAEWAQWEGDADAFLDALVECRVRREGSGFVERSATERLLIHEWDEHEGRLIDKLEGSKRRNAAAREKEKEERRLAGEVVRDRQRPREDQTPHITRYRKRKEAAAQAPESTDEPGAPGTALALAGTAPNKNAHVIDLIRAGGIEPSLTPQDHKAIKDTKLTPEQIAEVFAAIFTGAWGSNWMRENLTVADAIKRWNGYAASKTPRMAPPAASTIGQPSPVAVTQAWRAT